MKKQKQKPQFTPLFAALAAIGAAAISASSASAQTYDFTLRANDTDGATTSFNGKNNWNDANGVAATHEPRAEYTYYVGGAFMLRTPQIPEATFLGSQLTIDSGANINWKTKETDGTMTITNLVLRGKIGHGMDHRTGTLKGNYFIPSDANALIEMAGGNPRGFNIEAALSGSGALRFQFNSSDGNWKNLRLLGDNSAFTGPILMARSGGSQEVHRLAITNEVNLGGSPAAFRADQLTVNNITLMFDGDPVTTISDPNRGITITGNATQFEVPADRAAMIYSPITGAGLLKKMGAGMLILDSTNSYTGATTISAGTLAFNSTNGHSAVSVQAAGAIGGTGAVNTAVTFANGASVLLAGNGFGALALNTPSGISLNNAKLSFDLRSTGDGASDRLDIAGALALNGSSVISFVLPPDGLAAGEYELVTYASKTGSGTVALSMNYPNTALETTPSNIVFKVYAGLYSIALESLPAKKIASTTAILPADITTAPSVGGDLRVYFNEGSDGGDTASGWARHADFSPANDTGIYDIPVAGLELGKTYHYRHAYIINGTEIFFASASLSFTTLDENLPNTFRYSPTADNMLMWDNADAWIPDDDGIRELRKLPGQPGDTIQALDNRSYKFTLPSATTLGAIRTAGGNNFYLSPTNNAQVTLTFDARSPGATNLLQTDNVQSILLGDWAAATRDNLVIQLNQPLRVTKTGNNENTRILFNAAITGGTAGNPTPITFERTGGSHMLAFLRNPNNTFVGDIHVGSAGTTRSIRLYIGDYIQDMNGNLGSDFRFGFSVADSMFGDPSNRIFLRGSSYINMHNPASTFVFNRTVFGTGQIRAANTDGWTNDQNDDPRALNVGADAVFSPGEGNTTGELAFFANPLNLDPDTTFKIKVSPNSNDKINFNIRANRTANNPATVGELNLAGNVEIIPVLAPNERLNFGDRWEIATCVNTNTIVNGALSSGTKYFRITTEPATAATGYKIFATYLYSGTTIIVR